MFLHLLVTLLLSTSTDSAVYVNENAQLAWSGRVQEGETTKNIVKKIKQSTKVSGGLVSVFQEGCWKFQTPEGKIVLDSCIEEFKLVGKQRIAISKHEKWGVMNLSGTITTPINYSEIKFSDGILLGKELNQIKVLNKNAQEEKELTFEQVRFLSPVYMTYTLGGKIGIINYTKDKKITPPEFEAVNLLYDRLFAVRKNEKWGIVTAQGKTILPLEYDAILQDTLGFIKLKNLKQFNRDELKRFKIKEEKSGICDSKGNILIPVIYEDIGTYANNMYPVKKNEDWGFVNLKGEQVIPFFYKKTQRFCYDLAPVAKGYYTGVIDRKGSWVIPPEYVDISVVTDSVWIWTKRDRSGFFLPKTKTFSKETYEEIKPLEGGCFRYTMNGKFGLLTPGRRPILPPEYSSMRVFPSEKIILADKIFYYSIFYLNGNLKVFMNYPFTRFSPFVEGMAMVAQNDRFGFIDKDGQLLVSTQYDEARPFSNGMAAIRLNKKWGFVDKNENIVASPNYEEVFDFKGDATAAKRNGKWAILHKNGKEIISAQYDDAKQLPTGDFIVKSKFKFGLITKDGIETINPIYRDCIPLATDIIKVRNYNKYTVVNAKNQFLIPKEYDDILYSDVAEKIILINKGEWKGVK